MTETSIALVAVGGLLELVGVLMVAGEIRRNVRQARDLFEDEVAPRRTTWERYTAGGHAHSRGRRDLASVYDVDLLWKALYDSVGELEQRMDKRDDELSAELEADMVERNNELRSALREALAPDVGWPYAGVAALALGLILNTAGGVLGVAS